MKFIHKSISLLILLLILFSSVTFVLASEKSNLQQQQSTLNKQIEEATDELHSIQSQKSANLNQINTLNSQITAFEDELDTLQMQIDDLNNQITTKQEEITKKEKDYEENKQLLDKRLVAIYKTGKMAYLDVLLNADGLSDFISKYYLISKLTEHDTNLLNSIMAEKEEIEKAKAELESKRIEVQNSKQTIEVRRNELAAVSAQKMSIVNQLSSEERGVQEELDAIERDKAEIRRRLNQIAAQEAAAAAKAAGGSGSSSAAAKISASGFIFPVQGLSRGNIANKSYPSYAGHTGVDVNIGVVGKRVVAVKGGTVITSRALRSSSGAYRSYGEYIVIYHGNGVATLYGHGLAGSRLVSEGQTVSQGQAIMTVGSTGNSTGPHLHFEVRINGSPVNPLGYLP